EPPPVMIGVRVRQHLNSIHFEARYGTWICGIAVNPSMSMDHSWPSTQRCGVAGRCPYGCLQGCVQVEKSPRKCGKRSWHTPSIQLPFSSKMTAVEQEKRHSCSRLRTSRHCRITSESVFSSSYRV